MCGHGKVGNDLRNDHERTSLALHWIHSPGNFDSTSLRNDQFQELDRCKQDVPPKWLQSPLHTKEDQQDPRKCVVPRSMIESKQVIVTIDHLGRGSALDPDQVVNTSNGLKNLPL